MLVQSQEMPSLRQRRSLLLRLGIAMASITALAIIGMLSSVLIARTLDGFAAAINQAGTLRMQSYRIASSLVHVDFQSMAYATQRTGELVKEYNERLRSPRIHNVLKKGASERVMQAYLAVERHWLQLMEPPLRAYISLQQGAVDDPARERQKAFYLSNVDGFVEEIHHFVKVLELDAEEKTRQLHLIQLISLVLTLIVVFFSLYLTKKNIVVPLKDLLICANAARRRDFSVRSKYLNDDELGQLGAAFNLMAEDLSRIYEDLENRVKEKTANLERSNKSLELLYTTSRRLSESAPTVAVLTDLIQDIERLTGCSGGSICLGRPGEGRPQRLATTRELSIQADCSDLECVECFASGNSHLFEIDDIRGRSCQFVSIPIKDQEQQFGALVLELSGMAEQRLDEWQLKLLETVASHIAIAISMARQASQSRMLALQEERSVIARELHDSLAQSLSYLKIQVSRLEKEIKEDSGQVAVLQVSGMLRKGLNGAYRQLRELLTTFRLRINPEGLSAALADTVNEFRERSSIEITLNDRLANCQFNPNAEIHVIQIVREALSNVLRHSHASQACVDAVCDSDGVVRVVIEDDGSGIGEESEMLRHYGLPIMQERAEWLGGRLTIDESPIGGTRITLFFSVINNDGSPSHNHLVQGM